MALIVMLACCCSFKSVAPRSQSSSRTTRPPVPRRRSPRASCSQSISSRWSTLARWTTSSPRYPAAKHAPHHCHHARTEADPPRCM